MRTDILAEEWGVITRFLPEGWRELARSTGALKRTRRVRSADVLLRLIFLYAGSGLSLQQAAARAAMADLAKLSNVALMKRMRNARPWLQALAEAVFAESRGKPSLKSVPAGRRLRVVDATHVNVAASKGTDWRLHYVLALPTLACDFAEVTDSTGGETYARVPVHPGDVILGDRGYCHREGVAHVIEHGGDVVVRLNSSSFPLLDETGKRLDLVAAMRTLKEHEPGSWTVRFEARGAEYTARLCAIRKSVVAAESAKARLRKAARKKGNALRPETLELAEYIFVLATPGLDDLRNAGAGVVSRPVAGGIGFQAAEVALRRGDRPKPGSGSGAKLDICEASGGAADGENRRGSSSFFPLGLPRGEPWGAGGGSSGKCATRSSQSFLFPSG